jgi:hypothetical protein
MRLYQNLLKKGNTEEDSNNYRGISHLFTYKTYSTTINSRIRKTRGHVGLLSEQQWGLQRGAHIRGNISIIN